MEETDHYCILGLVKCNCRDWFLVDAYPFHPRWWCFAGHNTGLCSCNECICDNDK